MPTLEEAIEQIRMGNREGGRLILEKVLEEDENNEEVWLWLSSVVDTDEDREICLENVLALNPNNIVAQKGLEALQSGTFNVNEIFGDVIEEESEDFVDDDQEITFIDDFIVGDEEGDDDLVFPDSMSKSRGKSGGLNVRMIIIAALVLVLILVLAGAGGAYFFFLGGDGTPVETPSGQETPGAAPGVEDVPTDTPTPAPTDTPTATFTPALTLPTARPTNTPSPTATTVVSPTPGG